LAVNDPDAAGTIIRPRLRVLLSGVEVPQSLAANIENNNAYHGDRFTVSFAPTLADIGSVAWFAELAMADAVQLFDVQIGVLPNGNQEGDGINWQSMVQGEADSFDYSTNNNCVTIQGRDLTARMIDTKTQIAYVTQTSSEVVTAIAQKHGLTPVVTATTTPVGRFWSAEHDNIALNQFHRVTTEWDLVCTLARFEQFDAFVVGTSLYFQPFAKPSDDPYVLTWQQDQYGNQLGNVPALSLSRAYTIAKGVQVIVKSWNAKQKRSFQRGVPSNKPVSTSNVSVQQYVYVIPDLTEDQAQQRANAIYADIIKHEYRIRASNMIGDDILTPRNIIQLTGTGTAFDAIYYPTHVSRRIDIHGYTMSLEARTSSQANENASQATSS
jgi:hypothetical protein